MRNRQTLLPAVIFVATTALFTVFAKKKFHSFNEKQSIDQLVWVFLLNPSISEHDALFSNLDASKKTLVSMLATFNGLKKGPTNIQVKKFKVQTATEINALCEQSGNRQIVACQSAKILNELVDATFNAGDTSQALSYFKFLKIFNHDSINSTAQLSLLKKTETENSADPLVKLILRTAQARLMIRTGDFKTAGLLLNHGEKDFSPKNSSLNYSKLIAKSKINESSFESYASSESTRTLCQAVALEQCSTESVKSCATDKFWASWNKGCALDVPQIAIKTTLQNSDSLSQEQTMMIASWWSAVIRNKILRLEKWDSLPFKTISSMPITEAERYQTQFLNSVKSALNFVVAVKSSEPQDLLKRARELNLNNPLWAWTQKIALKELGSQWLAIVRSPERLLMTQYNLTPKIAPRSVAGDP